MVMTYENLETFTQVATRYHNTKPMRGKHAGKDVRPVADRSRAWERIKKISDDCYLFMFHGYADDVFQYYYPKGNPTQEEMVALAPICWKKRKDGSETVTVRNGVGRGAHMGHYSFLTRMLPRGMAFSIYNGKQFITADSGKHYLPKCMYVPKSIYDARNLNHKWDSWMQEKDDGSSLTFLRTGTSLTERFSLISKECKEPKPPSILVDKKAKAKHKDAIASYLEWISTIAPMLPVGDWQYVNEKRNELWEAQRSIGLNGRTHDDFAIQVITEQDHPQRLAMAVDFIHRYGTIRNVQSQNDVKQVRAEYNRWINKKCGFAQKRKKGD